MSRARLDTQCVPCDTTPMTLALPHCADRDCRALYVPRAAHQRYCSDRCRVRRWRRSKSRARANAEFDRACVRRLDDALVAREKAQAFAKRTMRKAVRNTLVAAQPKKGR